MGASILLPLYILTVKNFGAEEFMCDYQESMILIVEECILLRLYTIKHDNHVTLLASKVT
jgi:hypothetical protein